MLRSAFTHKGGSWAIPGGAIDEDETPLEAALREFAEEVGMELSDHVVADIHEADHGGWSYWTVIVDVPGRFPLPVGLNWETDDVRWVRRGDIRQLELFGPFAVTLEKLGLA